MCASVWAFYNDAVHTLIKIDWSPVFGSKSTDPAPASSNEASSNKSGRGYERIP